MAYLLDSVILIDHFNGVEAATRYLQQHHHEIAISVITQSRRAERTSASVRNVWRR